MSTWSLITVKNSMKTIQTLVELVITWGSSLRSAGLSFWNKQTKTNKKKHLRLKKKKKSVQTLLQYTHSTFRTGAPGVTFYFVMENVALQDGRRRSQLLNKEPVVCLGEVSPWKIKSCLGALDLLQQGWKPQRVPEKWGVIVQYHSLSQNTALNESSKMSMMCLR